MPTPARTIRIVSLIGPPSPYNRALALQRDAHKARLDGRIGDTIYLLEHSPVVTIGRGAHGVSNLRSSAESLRARGIAVAEADRGGDVTYHAPGQLVAYPILDLDCMGRDLHRYLRTLELIIIDALSEFGVGAEAVPGLTGVWTATGKIAAIGIRVSRWVSMHGFAINNDLDLGPMRRDIVPCGIADRPVTSLREEGSIVSRRQLESALAIACERQMNCKTNRESATLDRELARMSISADRSGLGSERALGVSP